MSSYLERAEISPLQSSKGKRFIKKHHYTGTCHNGPKCWGLVVNNELHGVIAFANPITEDIRRQVFGESFRGTVFGLHRVVTLDKCPKNVESWFVRKGLNCLQADSPQYWAVVSFADSTVGHTGLIYQATNAIYFGKTDGTYRYVDQDGNLRTRRDDNETISKKEAHDKGWEVAERDGKHSYLFLLPKNKRHERKLHELLQVEKKPYPNNDTMRQEQAVERDRDWMSDKASDTDW